jgi:MFS family permease
MTALAGFRILRRRDESLIGTLRTQILQANLTPGRTLTTLPNSTRQERVPRRRWGIAWLLGFGVLVNYFDRVNLSVSHAALYTAFGISNITFGYLSGAYNWTYAMCQLPVGVLLDRFGVRRVGRISTLVWSVASFAAAITPRSPDFLRHAWFLVLGRHPRFRRTRRPLGCGFHPGKGALPPVSSMRRRNSRQRSGSPCSASFC